MGAALKGRSGSRAIAGRPRRRARHARQGQPLHLAGQLRGRRSHRRRGELGADGLIRFATQMSQARPETAALIRRLMADRGLKVATAQPRVQTICRDVPLRGLTRRGQPSALSADARRRQANRRAPATDTTTSAVVATIAQPDRLTQQQRRPARGPGTAAATAAARRPRCRRAPAPRYQKTKPTSMLNTET